MGLPVELFPPDELAERVQRLPSGRKRKKRVELSDCQLLELWQYNCHVENWQDLKSAVVCNPIQRLFRRCEGGLTVETTAWEGIYDTANRKTSSTGVKG